MRNTSAGVFLTAAIISLIALASPISAEARSRHREPGGASGNTRRCGERSGETARSCAAISESTTVTEKRFSGLIGGAGARRRSSAYATKCGRGGRKSSRTGAKSAATTRNFAAISTNTAITIIDTVTAGMTTVKPVGGITTTAGIGGKTTTGVVLGTSIAGAVAFGMTDT